MEQRRVMLRRLYYSARARTSIVARDLKTHFPLPLRTKLRMWYHGFLAEKYVLYDLGRNDPRQFLSDYHASQSRWINEPYTSLLTNKYLFEQIAGKFIRVPRTLALLSRGHVCPIDADSSVKRPCDVVELCRKCPVVLKPVCGGGGKGVMKLASDEGQILCNSERKSVSEMCGIVNGLSNYLATEFIHQGDFAASLNPGTTNTMRIVTLVDIESNEPFIARAVQRIGNASSAPQDNFTRGGLSALIDLDSGILGSAASHPKTRTLEWHDKHPDTKEAIAGRCIPGWEEVKRTLLSAARGLGFLKCIGWDLLATNDELVAIEGNHHPDPDVLQCHGALLTDDRVRKFYRRHGVL